MANIDSTFTGIINTVFEKAAPHLTAEELGTLEMQGEVGKYTIRHLAEHIEGLACLVRSDSDDSRNGISVGSFQSPDALYSLLLSIQQTLEGAHARIDLADIALLERERREYKTTALQQAGGVQ